MIVYIVLLFKLDIFLLRCYLWLSMCLARLLGSVGPLLLKLHFNSALFATVDIIFDFNHLRPGPR